MKKESIFVIFSQDIPQEKKEWWVSFETVVAPKILHEKIESYGCTCVPLEDFVEAGSIYEASAFVEELSRLTLPDGTCLVKSATYEGYELWWMHYTDLFTRFCLPYTQYKKLLTYTKDYEQVHMYNAPFESLFSCYLNAYDCIITHIHTEKRKTPAWLPFGIVIQIVLTLMSLPVLMVQCKKIMVFIGDKFEGQNDFDFRMKFIYKELRSRNHPFVEFVRSLQPWNILLLHAFRRKRPVIYASAITFLARYASILSGDRARSLRRFDAQQFVSVEDREKRFKLTIATQYLLTVSDEVWEIRFMKFITRLIGIQAGFIGAASERNFATVLACKLNTIPTVGILHGVSSRHYNVYDFLPGYDSKKSMSVDIYGVWSEWWKTYYETYSRVYTPEQLIVSGPMRPLTHTDAPILTRDPFKDTVRVLFISEEMAVPEEVIPYIYALMESETVRVTIKFRPYPDGFEKWLMKHMPDLLTHEKIHLVRGSILEALNDADVVVGCQSTAVLEGLLQLKVPLFFNTHKWGDYYSMKGYGDGNQFFAENPTDLVNKIMHTEVVRTETLLELKERYFGDPYKNGSMWVVDQIVKAL